MKSAVYYQLWRMNAAYDQILECLDALRSVRVFRPQEIDRCRAFAQEARADANSYLTSQIEIAETDQASRRYRRRRAREREDEEGK